MKAFFRLVLSALLSLVAGANLLPTARAQFVQQGGKLAGDTTAGPLSQGASVALSGDGNTAMVGGPQDGPTTSGSAGAAWVFTRSAGVWTSKGFKLVGVNAAGYASQGTSVALSGDGNTAIVGGPEDDGSPADPQAAIGAVWVYTRTGNAWTQQGGKLVGTGTVVGAQQGTSVAISSDGNTAVVGGPADNADTGAVWVFTRSGTAWTQQGGKLVGTGSGAGARQGASVALSADGNTAVVGGPGDNGNTGAMWVFTRSGNVWTQQGNKLIGTAAGVSAQQGFSVAISGDGNSAAAGGPQDNGGMGAVWIFTRSGSVWTQQGNKLVGTGSVSVAASCGTAEPANGSCVHEGASVALSANGNTAVIGAPFDNALTGASWVFTRSGNVWTQTGSKLLGSDGDARDQGAFVAISGDGETAMIGGYEAAWVFVSAPTTTPISPALPVITEIANGASFAQGTISPGSWATIFGTGLAPTGDSRTWNAATEIVNGIFPVGLDGTSVTVNGKPAAVEFVQSSQVNIQAPDDIAVGPIQVILTGAAGVSNSFTVNYAVFAPGLFPAAAPYIVAQHADDTYVTTAAPAKPGEVIILWGTGFGPANPAVQAGQVFSGANPLANAVTVTIGGQPAVVDFAGVVAAGLVQINAQVPSTIGNGDAAVVATVGGVSTQTTANMISIHN